MPAATSDQQLLKPKGIKRTSLRKWRRFSFPTRARIKTLCDVWMNLKESWPRDVGFVYVPVIPTRWDHHFPEAHALRSMASAIVVEEEASWP
jgi:hypothetical protein